MLRGVLRFVLRVKSLTINTCCGVAGFPDQHMQRLSLGVGLAPAASRGVQRSERPTDHKILKAMNYVVVP